MVPAVKAKIKLALKAGKANPAPPIGPALGSKVSYPEGCDLLVFQAPQLTGSVCAPQQVNIMAFCKEYNARTQDKAGQVIPVEITVYEVRGWCCCSPSQPTLDTHLRRWLQQGLQKARLELSAVTQSTTS